MPLSAQDVHDKQFKLVRQSTGYDIEEVDAFLDEVEAELTRLAAELAAARAGRPATAGGGLDAGASAARILELAQRTADEVVAEARRTAELLVGEAEQRSRSAVAALEVQRADLEARVDSLRERESGLRSRMTSYLEAQLRELRSPAERGGDRG